MGFLDGLFGSSSTSTPAVVTTPGLYGTSTAPAQSLANFYLQSLGLTPTYSEATSATPGHWANLPNGNKEGNHIVWIPGTAAQPAQVTGFTGSLQNTNPFMAQQVNTSLIPVEKATFTAAPAGVPVTFDKSSLSPSFSQVGYNASNITPQVTSAYGGELQKQLLNPSFNPNAVQTALINKATDMANASAAAKGLGPASEVEKIAAISPLLANMQQQNISNLMGANQADINQQLAQNQFGLSQNQLNNQFMQAAQNANNLNVLNAANFGLSQNQLNNQLMQAAQNANNAYGLAANQQTNMFGQEATKLNNAANLAAAQQQLLAQTQQGQFNNQATTNNLEAQQQQLQNLMVMLGLAAPGTAVTNSTTQNSSNIGSLLLAGALGALK